MTQKVEHRPTPLRPEGPPHVGIRAGRPPRAPRGWWFAPLILAALALSSCGKGTTDRPEGAKAPDLRSARVAPTSKPSDRAKDPLWQYALEGDELEAAHLADREGARGLLAGVEEGGAIGQAALRALPHADDAELALERLGEIARQLDGDQAVLVLDTILATIGRPRTQREPLDPPGTRSLGEALAVIARKTSLPVRILARAISGLRLLAERRVVDPRTIPTDLDPASPG